VVPESLRLKRFNAEVTTYPQRSAREHTEEGRAGNELASHIEGLFNAQTVDCACQPPEIMQLTRVCTKHVEGSQRNVVLFSISFPHARPREKSGEDSQPRLYQCVAGMRL
jgi:hypothetical protein